MVLVGVCSGCKAGDLHEVLFTFILFCGIRSYLATKVSFIMNRYVHIFTLRCITYHFVLLITAKIMKRQHLCS